MGGQRPSTIVTALPRPRSLVLDDNVHPRSNTVFYTPPQRHGKAATPRQAPVELDTMKNPTLRGVPSSRRAVLRSIMHDDVVSQEEARRLDVDLERFVQRLKLRVRSVRVRVDGVAVVDGHDQVSTDTTKSRRT